MLTHPQIDPVALAIGPLKIHWYGLMYLLGFAGAWGLAKWRVIKQKLPWTDEQLSDLIFYGAIGVVLGGRVGYMVFYNLGQLLHSPLSLFKIWQGGMSFHGGLLGVIAAMFYFSRKSGKSFLTVTDFIAPLVPLGLAAGRLGNFINGELWGRVTTMPWGMVFPMAGPYPRHPSQLYEFGLEGCLLFLVIWLYAKKTRAEGALSGTFLLLYGLFRLFVECFREPDAPIGFIAFDWLTMGQLLSIPMILIGGWLLIRAK